MNPSLFPFLSMLCLVSSAVTAEGDQDMPTNGNSTHEALNTTTSGGTSAIRTTPMLTNNSSTTSKYTESRPTSVAAIKASNASPGSKCGESCLLSNTTPQIPTPTAKADTGKGKVRIVGTLLFLVCVLIVLFLILLRWYSRNPDRRSIRGLCSSLVDSMRQAWLAVAARIRSPQKQPGDEETEEMGTGRGEEGLEGGVAGDGNRWGKKEDEGEDDSSDDYSSMESGNVVDNARKEEGAQRKAEEEDDDGEGEMTTPILLGDENTDTEEEDDVTPL
ncbi:uncharacterized protein LOC118241987 [Electrophorus electricus]|uniref:uncharacterized protein LOC118241987 n=1 Tax=Electrophorus electricus TaxID=8005 RepID=UPI0015D0C861|nr:uncharacterized protein LOC118241987 [Electrophorus electricus]